MRTVVRWVVVLVVVLHGLLHLLGAAKGFGWAEVSALTVPVSPVMGAAWLGSGTLVVVAGVLLARASRWFWVVGAVATLASQAMILSSWRDAQVGSLANVVLLAAVVYGYRSQGPTSHAAEYRRGATAALAGARGETVVVTDRDLTSLPPALADYLRGCGVVGKPRASNFRARFHGRIRASGDAAWMPFTGEQVNTFGPRPSRRFLMDATRGGLPVDVLHVYQEATATMRVDLCSLVPMVNAGGPELDRAETVTVFNDLCLLAPSALVGAPIAWRSIDAHRTEGTFTNGPLTVRAELVFDQDHQLVDFVSDDRFRAGTDGRPSRPEQWSTPIRGRGTVDGTQVVTDGDGRWRGPEGDFTYLEFHLDEIAYDVTTPGAVELVRPERVVPSSVMLGDGSAATTGLRP